MMLTLPWGARGNFAGRCASCWERTASDWHTASMSPGDTEPGEKDGVRMKINWFSHEVWIFLYVLLIWKQKVSYTKHRPKAKTVSQAETKRSIYRNLHNTKTAGTIINITCYIRQGWKNRKSRPAFRKENIMDKDERLYLFILNIALSGW